MIVDMQGLRERYSLPAQRAVAKQLSRLEVHSRRFIAMSPFLVISSGGGEVPLDASPRGGEPGFVKVRDDHTVLIPDAQGNNRLDTLTNILATSRVGLVFLIPGVDETLRINGTARLRDEAQYLELFSDEKKLPKLVIEITVAEAYLHCGKAMMRSKLWNSEARIERAALPSMGQMLKDQTGSAAPAESQDEMVAQYIRNM